MTLSAILFASILFASSPAATAAADLQNAPAENPAMPIKQIGVYVLPYYQAANTPDGTPIVAVAEDFDEQLASRKREDIIAVMNAIQAHPERIAPITLMVLAIRLYDTGLRDDGVFWFYVAKDRYLVMADVVTDGVKSVVGTLAKREIPHPDESSGQSWAEDQVYELYPKLSEKFA